MEGTDTAKLVMAEVFGDYEWWHSSGEKMYEGLARTLIQHGFTFEQAANFLSAAFNAVADEYGD